MDILNTLLSTIESTGAWGYSIVMLISLVETLAFVGLAIPGSVILLFAGFVASRHILDIGDLIWFTAIGIALGDGISFYLGKKGVKFLRRHDKIFKDEHFSKAQTFFKKHGGKSIFFGKFISPLRPVIPFVAGVSHMDIKKFFCWSLISAFSFATAFLLTGYFLGGAWHLFQKWFTIGEYSLFAIASASVLLFVCRFFIVKRKNHKVINL